MSKAPQNLRGTMPRCAQVVDEYRSKFGQQHVDACIRAGLAGQANQFFASEKTADGQRMSIGTPFTGPAAHRVREFWLEFGPLPMLVMIAEPKP